MEIKLEAVQIIPLNNADAKKSNEDTAIVLPKDANKADHGEDLKLVPAPQYVLPPTQTNYPPIAFAVDKELGVPPKVFFQS